MPATAARAGRGFCLPPRAAGRVDAEVPQSSREPTQRAPGACLAAAAPPLVGADPCAALFLLQMIQEPVHNCADRLKAKMKSRRERFKKNDERVIRSN